MNERIKIKWRKEKSVFNEMNEFKNKIKWMNERKNIIKKIKSA